MNPRQSALVVLLRVLIGGAGLMSSLMAVSAQGVVTAFDSFGPGGTYNAGAALPVGGNTRRAGFAFTPSVSGRLFSVELPLLCTIKPNSLEVGIYRTDFGTGFPSTAVEIFSADGLLPELGIAPGSTVSFQSSLTPVLEPATQYWVVVTVPAGAEVEWYAIPRDVPERYYLSGDDSGEKFSQARPPSAFKISVTPIPEPTMSGMVLFGMVILFAARRQSRSVRSLPDSSANDK